MYPMDTTILFKLAGTAILPVAVTVILYLLEHLTKFRALNYKAKQVIIGGLFGLLAVYATETGVLYQGATINVRDTAPLCAGLIFGGPAGIIAGIIGGVHRFFAAYQSAGSYTQVACTVSTIVAGIAAALLRKFVFDNRKPTWLYALMTAVVIEVFHMLMIIFTHGDDIKYAFRVVKRCSFPMIAVNGIAVMLAALIVSIIGRRHIKHDHHVRRISQTFSGWLLLCVALAFTCTTLFSSAVQNQISSTNTLHLLEVNIEDVKQDISDKSDEHLLNIAETVANSIEEQGVSDISRNDLLLLQRVNNVADVNIIDKYGMISISTEDEYIGFNMGSSKQSSEFLVLINGKRQTFVQSYQPTGFDNTEYKKYAGVALSDGGFVQVGYDAKYFQREIEDNIQSVVVNRHVGEDGYIVILDEDGGLVAYGSAAGNKPDLSALSAELLKSEGSENLFECTVDGVKSYCMYEISEGYFVIAIQPSEEADFSNQVAVYLIVFMEFLVFGFLFVLVYFLIKTLIVDNIKKINKSLARITHGDLNEVVNVRSNMEFASLSDDINSTVVTMKKLIKEAEERIDKELEFAKNIQHSALPSVFPPYPNRKEFDIYARMDTAKEVGGDFYDFYFIGENHLAFLIADVSGKGIPAAMFMMTAKTMIKSLAESGLSVEEALTLANNKLCETNDAGMFVTVWLGILNTETGDVEYAVAGHNPPLIRHGDGQFEYLKTRAGLVLAGMDGIKYRRNQLKLSPGDVIYLYTDGVTEANNKDKELYGEERLRTFLNTRNDTDMETLCGDVKADVDGFVGEADQFDDITMLALRYNGK